MRWPRPSVTPSTRTHGGACVCSASSRSAVDPSHFNRAIGPPSCPCPYSTAPPQQVPGQPGRWAAAAAQTRPPKEATARGWQQHQPEVLPLAFANQHPGELTQPSCLWNTIYRSPSCAAKFILLLQQPLALAPLSPATSCIAAKKRFVGGGSGRGKASVGENPFRSIQAVQPKRSSRRF